MIPSATVNIKKYLQPEVVSQLSRLDVIARLVVEGFITGLHRSPYHGFSAEFSEYRPYMTGEDTSRIDWKVLGRTERYYVKQFEEETNLKAYLLLDVSESMQYTSGDISKFFYASCLASALTYLMIQQRDAVGLVTFNETIQNFMPPKSVKSYFLELIKSIEKTPVGGGTQIAPVLHEIAERIKRRGLIIILSDFMDDQNAILNALNHFRYKNHEIIIFHILDAMELSFEFKKESILYDMESEASLRVHPAQIKNEYKRLVDQWKETYLRSCRAHRIDYIPIHTKQSFDQALIHYLAKRKRLGG